MEIRVQKTMSENLSIPEKPSGKRPDYDANDPNPGDRAYQEVVLPDAKVKAAEEGINNGQEVLSEVAPIVSLENPLPQETGEEISEEELKRIENEKKWLDPKTSKEWMLSRIYIDSSGIKLDRKLQLFAVACGRRVWSALKNEEKKVFEAAEMFADGEIDSKSLDVARESVYARRYSLLLRRPSASPGRSAAYYAAEKGDDQSPRTPHPYESSAFHVAHIFKNDSENDKQNIEQALYLKDIFRNPFIAPIIIDPAWRTSTVNNLAEAAYEDRSVINGQLDKLSLNALADALEDAGCDNEEILDHLHNPKYEHVRGCWCLDLILQKEEKQEDEK